MKKKVELELLNKKILNTVGLDVKDQKIIDQDTMQDVTFRGKNLKYDSNEPVTLHRNDMIFDPYDKRIISDIFVRFLKKEEEENNNYTQIYYDKIKDNKSALEVIMNDKTITSDYYENDSLKYIDMMLKISEEDRNINLVDYDKPNKIVKRRTARG